MITTRTLADACIKITDGTHHSPPIVEEGVPYVTAKHVKDHGIRFFDNPWYVSEKSHAEIYSRCDPKPGDVLYIKDGATTGVAAVNDYDFPFSMLSSVALLRPNPELCISAFLCRWLNSPIAKNRFIRRMGGAAIKRLTLAKIKKFQIPLPPLPEQKRIAGILDAADALRARRRESLAQLDSLLESTFLDMFGDPVTNPLGWEKVTLPNFSQKLTDGPFGSNLKSSHYVDDGVRVIRLQNIGVGELLDNDLAFISPDHFASLPRNHCKPGDVIVATLGDPNLRACIVPSELRLSLNKADCLLMRVDESRAINVYVCWLLNCPATVAKALELVRGQTRGRISLGRLKELQVPLPPLDLQRHFATIVESIERQKARQRTHLAELNALFASLQSRAFNGEL